MLPIPTDSLQTMTSAGVCYDEETVQAEMLRKQELSVHSNI